MDLERRVAELEKKVADLEGQVQDQPSINSILEAISEGLQQNLD